MNRWIRIKLFYCQNHQIIFRFFFSSCKFSDFVLTICDPEQYQSLFSTFSAFIFRNQEFSLTYSDCDSLLDKLSTLIKAVKSSRPNWNFNYSQIPSRACETLKSPQHKLNQRNKKKTRCFEFQLGCDCKAFQTMSLCRTLPQRMNLGSQRSRRI